MSGVGARGEFSLADSGAHDQTSSTVLQAVPSLAVHPPSHQQPRTQEIYHAHSRPTGVPNPSRGRAQPQHSALTRSLLGETNAVSLLPSAVSAMPAESDTLRPSAGTPTPPDNGTMSANSAACADLSAAVDLGGGISASLFAGLQDTSSLLMPGQDLLSVDPSAFECLTSGMVQGLSDRSMASNAGTADLVSAASQPGAVSQQMSQRGLNGQPSNHDGVFGNSPHVSSDQQGQTAFESTPPQPMTHRVGGEPGSFAQQVPQPHTQNNGLQHMQALGQSTSGQDVLHAMQLSPDDTRMAEISTAPAQTPGTERARDCTPQMDFAVVSGFSQEQPSLELPQQGGLDIGSTSPTAMAREHAALISALNAPLGSWPPSFGDLSSDPQPASLKDAHDSRSGIPHQNATTPVAQHSNSFQLATQSQPPIDRAQYNHGTFPVAGTSGKSGVAHATDGTSQSLTMQGVGLGGRQHSGKSADHLGQNDLLHAVMQTTTVGGAIGTNGKVIGARATRGAPPNAPMLSATTQAGPPRPGTSKTAGIGEGLRAGQSALPPSVTRLEFTAMPPAAPSLTSPNPLTPQPGPPARGFRGSGGTLATKPTPPPTPAASAAARGIRKRARAAARAASSPLPPDSGAADRVGGGGDGADAAVSVAQAATRVDGLVSSSKAAAVVSKQTANNRVVAALEHAKKNKLDVDGPELATLNKRAQRIIRTREAASRNRQEQKAKMLRLKTRNEDLIKSQSQLEVENTSLNQQLEKLRLLMNSPLLAEVTAELKKQKPGGVKTDTQVSDTAPPVTAASSGSLVSKSAATPSQP